MSLNIPITRMQADNGFNMGRASEITRDELKFAKFIDRMRVKFAELFLNSVKTQLLGVQAPIVVVLLFGLQIKLPSLLQML